MRAFFFCLLFSSSLLAQNDTKSHVSSDKMFIITYPSTWKENEIESATSEYCINAPGAGLFSMSMIKMEIKKMAEGYENADIHQISDVELKMLKAQPDQSMNLEILESKFQKMNDHEWWIIKGKMKKGKKDYFTDSYKTIHNRKVYIFTYVSNEKNYEKNREDAKKIIASVEFLTKNGESVSIAKTNTTNSSEDRVNDSGDDRVGNSIPIIGDKPLWSIKSATGWMKNFEGQWIRGKNKIQKYKVSAVGDTSAWNKGINATGLDNFTSIEVRDVKIGNKLFIVIIKLMLDGQNKYEYSANSWQPIIRYKFFVVKKNEAILTPRFEKDGSVQYEMQIYFRGYVQYDKDYLHHIVLKISQGDYEQPEMKEIGSTSNLYLDYKELNDGKRCRFVFPPTSGVDSPYEPTPQYQEFVYPPIGFSNYYYECDKSDIRGLLNIIEKK
ncbi:MAG: hypothetical protein JSS98_09275 [Bacteroidetes bacterium]|nr:hypothetical protein [Bacteroidota bacterium]